MIGLKYAGAIGAGALIFGSLSGWTVRGWYEADKVKDALTEQRRQHSEAIAEQQAAYDALLNANLQLANDLDAAERNVRTVTREIIREVPNAVQPSTPDNDCTLSPALVMLHNRAALGRDRDATDNRTPARLVPDTVSRP